MSDNATALAVRRPAAIGGYNPPPDEPEFRSMIFMAKQLSEAQGFVPAHFFRQPNKILAAMLYGRDLGITPTNAIQHIIVIDGKATADAQLMGMLVRRAGHRLEDVTTDTASTVTITRGDDGSKHVFTFTIADAKRAGLVRGGSAWEKYPQAMLYARALSGCARKGAQDALMGTAYTPEEIEGGTEPTGEIQIIDASPETQQALQEAQVASPTVEAAIQPAPPAAPVEPPAAKKRGGPRAKTSNVVKPEPVTAPAPPVTLLEDPEPGPGDTDDAEGHEAYLASQRQLLREAAAELAHVNAVLRNALEHPMKGEAAEPVPPAAPNPDADAALTRLLASDYPGQTLDALDETELGTLLARFESNLAKKKQMMIDKKVADVR